MVPSPSRLQAVLVLVVCCAFTLVLCQVPVAATGGTVPTGRLHTKPPPQHVATDPTQRTPSHQGHCTRQSAVGNTHLLQPAYNPVPGNTYGQQSSDDQRKRTRNDQQGTSIISAQQTADAQRDRDRAVSVRPHSSGPRQLHQGGVLGASPYYDNTHVQQPQCSSSSTRQITTELNNRKRKWECDDVKLLAGLETILTGRSTAAAAAARTARNSQQCRLWRRRLQERAAGGEQRAIECMEKSKIRRRLYRRKRKQKSKKNKEKATEVDATVPGSTTQQGCSGNDCATDPTVMYPPRPRGTSLHATQPPPQYCPDYQMPRLRSGESPLQQPHDSSKYNRASVVQQSLYNDAKVATPSTSPPRGSYGVSQPCQASHNDISSQAIHCLDQNQPPNTLADEADDLNNIAATDWHIDIGPYLADL